MNIPAIRFLSEKIALCATVAITFIFLFTGVYQSAAKNDSQNINVAEYYAALQSADTVKINSILKNLESLNSNLSQAYTGSLLMKKASLMKYPGEKLSMFKKGKNLLEESIKIENANAEFHFLRLVIQENCPSFLGYHDNINDDAVIVKANYKNFSAELKQAVKDYAKTSKTLKGTDFLN